MTQQSDAAAQRRRSFATMGLFGAILVGVGLAVFASPGTKQVSPEPSTPVVKPAPAKPANTARTAPTPKRERPKKPEPPVVEEEVRWLDPPEWKKLPRSGMRYASYEIPAVKGDPRGGELNVFILSGDVESNIQRWVSEFTKFDLKTVVRKTRTVNGMPQAIVEIPRGHFDGGMGDTKASDNYGLLGAILEVPTGSKYFFKLTAPSNVVKAARKPFYALLDSIREVKSTTKPAGTEPAGAAPGATSPAPAPAAPVPAPAPAAPAPAAPAPASSGAAPHP